MKRALLKKSILATIILVILVFNLTATSLFVGAEDPGTGKFLTITIDGNGSVVATKVKSGESWTFTYDDPPQTEKVGAGTVKLEAVAGTNWEFSHWDQDITGPDNPVNYKTRKYGEVTAVFVPITYTITASAGAGGSISPSGAVSVVSGNSQAFVVTPDFGYHILDVVVDTISQGPLETYEFVNVVTDHTISVEFEINIYTITATAHEGGSINPSGAVSVVHGDDVTFEFTPNTGYHVSAVVVDGEYVTLVPTTFTASYAFEDVIVDGHIIDVFFSPDGIADITAGDDVTVFLSSGVSLSFDSVGSGIAFGSEILSTDPGDVVVWEITVDAILGNQVIVALRYDDTGMTQNEEENLRLYISDVDYELYLHVDFNDDGVVDGQDVKIISNIVKHPKFIPDPEEDPDGYQLYLDNYDLDGSGTIDQLDIHIVNQLKEIEWTDITYGPVDTVNNIIYGLTDHFSIFRCR
jgi:hypothetical protein